MDTDRKIWMQPMADNPKKFFVYWTTARGDVIASYDSYSKRKAKRLIKQLENVQRSTRYLMII